MNRLIKNMRGFTLIEILVAILILLVVVVTLFSSFRAFVVSSESVKEDVMHSEKIRDVFKRVRLDFESVFVLQVPRYKKPEFSSDPDPYRFVGSRENLGQQTVSYLIFPSFAHAKLGEDQRTGVARIAYYLKENETNGYDLYRADALSPFPQEMQSCSDPLLCTDISGFEVLYRDLNGDEYEYWDSETEEFKHLFPAIVNLKIAFGSGDTEQIYEFFVDLAAGRMPIE